MRLRILAPLACVTALITLASPLTPVLGDVAVTVSFTDAKAVVQCPPDGLGRTGIGFSGLGVNKNKNCNWTFSNENAHKATNACVGIGVADALKKGNKKAPIEAGFCTISASGTLGPVLQWPGPNVKVPAALSALCLALGKPLNGTGGCDITKNQRFGGPWCDFSKGQSGAGSITVGTKTISFSQLRWQMQGGVMIGTASAFKPGVEKPGQAGPMLIKATVRFDDHKVVGGVPNSSCLTNGKNIKITGQIIAALMGTK